MLHKFFCFIFFLIFPLIVGYLGSTLSTDSKIVYNAFNRPPFSPPSELFGIVWTLLYIMIGFAAFLVSIKENTKEKTIALQVFFFQIFINFSWTFFFYTLEFRLFAFFWLIFLLIVVFYTYKAFYKISKFAAFLLVPYFFWLIYAAYLNLGIYILNR